MRTILLLPAFCTFVVLSLGIEGCNAGPDTASAHTAPHRNGNIEVHYSPFENLEKIDVGELQRSHSSVDVLAYSLTDRVVIEALIAAARRGVHVRVYLDNEETTSEMRRTDLATELQMLASTSNAEVRVKRSRVLQHTKAYVVDGQLLREGSANFSPSALKQQDNDLLLTDDQATIRGFEQNFLQEWERTDNVPLGTFAAR
jgi:phosphatidylserine/phosphatidylglycerophosphate/cardiolipin synthase-like enzyme